MKKRASCRIAASLLISLFSISYAWANACVSQVSGNWNAAGTWTSCGGLTPQAADTAQIAGGFTVTMNTTATVASLTVGSSNSNNISTLIFNAGSQLTVTGTVTLSGTNFNRSGVTNMAAGGTLIVNGATPFALGSGTVTWTPGTGTVQLTAANTLAYSAGVFDSFNNLIIASNTTNLGGATTVTGNLTVNGSLGGTSTLSLTGAGATISGTGSVTNTGTTTITNNKIISAGATLEFAGPVIISTGTTTNNGATCFGLSGGVCPSSTTATLTVNSTFANAGTLTTSSPTTIAGTFTNTGTVTASDTGTGIAGAGTWTNSTNSTLNVAGPLTVTTLTASANPNTVNYNGSGAQTIRATTYYNLTINKSGTTGTLAAAATVNGTLTITAGTLADGGFTLTAKGDLANSGTHSGAGKILLNGTAQQTLSGTGSYGNLELSNSSGALLSASPTVTGTLTFTSGEFTTGSNTLTIGAAGSIAGTLDGTRHVVGNLAKNYSAAGSFTYAVGDGTNYTPVTLSFTSLTTAGGLTVAVTNTDHPNTTSATDGVDAVKSINRYWTAKGSTLAGAYTALFNYVNGSPVDLDGGAATSNVKVRQGSSCSGSAGSRTCSGWTDRTTVSANCSSGTPSTTQACATGLSAVVGGTESDFALGELLSSNFARERQFIYTRELY